MDASSQQNRVAFHNFFHFRHWINFGFGMPRNQAGILCTNGRMRAIEYDDGTCWKMWV